MDIPDYIVTDGDALKIYPRRLSLVAVTCLCLFWLAVLLIIPVPTNIVSYTLVLVGTLLFSVLTIGFAREFWHKEPIVTITKTFITMRAIPLWAPETIAWSEIDDIAIVENKRNTFLFIYEKPGSSKTAPSWQRLLVPRDGLKRKKHYINAMFLPCSTTQLLIFLATLTEEGYLPCKG